MIYEITANRAAMLDTIAYAEGTGSRYDLLFGYGVFDVTGPHPNVKVPFGNTYSTAAGRYQFLYDTWQDTIPKIPQADIMLPDNQDQAAIQRMADRGALDAVDRGDIEGAIMMLNKEWASFPGSPYGQPTKSMQELVNYFNTQKTIEEVKKNWITVVVAIMAIIIVAGILFMIVKLYPALKS